MALEKMPFYIDLRILRRLILMEDPKFKTSPFLEFEMAVNIPLEIGTKIKTAYKSCVATFVVEEILHLGQSIKYGYKTVTAKVSRTIEFV